MSQHSHNKIRRVYSRVYHALGRAELQANPPEQELLIDLLFEPTHDYWLGFYTKDGLLLALERYGFLDDIRRLGYEELDIELVLDEPEEQLFRLVSKLPDLGPPLIEILARRSYLNLSRELRSELGDAQLPVLNVEWLLLQNPLKTFDALRPPLPGQLLPGLGLGREVFELLRNVCTRLKLAGLIVVPSYMHNGVFYDPDFHYCDPHYQGLFEALKRDLLGESPTPARIMQMTWAVRWGFVFDTNEEATLPFKWFHEPMVSVVSKQTRDFIESQWYQQERQQAERQHHFHVAEDLLNAKLQEHGIFPYNEEVFAQWQAREEGLV